MNRASDIKPVSALKREPANLINQARERKSPIVITQNGSPTAVLQDVESYEEGQRALHLLRLAVDGDLDHDARGGTSHAKTMKRLRERLRD